MKFILENELGYLCDIREKFSPSGKTKTIPIFTKDPNWAMRFSSEKDAIHQGKRFHCQLLPLQERKV